MFDQDHITDVETPSEESLPTPEVPGAAPEPAMDPVASDLEGEAAREPGFFARLRKLLP